MANEEVAVPVYLQGWIAKPEGIIAVSITNAFTMRYTLTLKTRTSVNYMQKAIPFLSFLLPFIAFGGFVALSVYKHLVKASYPFEQVQSGPLMFFLAAGIAAGIAGLVLFQLLRYKSDKSRFVSGFLFFQLLGYVLASVTLTDYYDNPSGNVVIWLIHTAQAYVLFGLLPSALCYLFGYMQNRSKELVRGVDGPAASV